jgi:hypothetical protein
MDMNRELDKLVDQCLSEIQTGELSLDSYLESHPEHADELGSLLNLAAHSHNILSPESPRSEFIKATGIRLKNSIQKRYEPSKAHRKRLFGIRLRPAYALIAIILVITLLSSGVGVFRASADSLPGDNLYGLKLAGERIQMALTLSSEKDALLLIEFAGERLNEAENLINLERYDDLEQALSGLDQTLGGLSSLDTYPNDPASGSLKQIESKLEKHLEVLTSVLEQVPESARPAIERAIERSSHSQDVIKNVKSENHPSDVAPGQLKKDEGVLDNDDHPGRGNGLDKKKPEKTEKPEKPK